MNGRPRTFAWAAALLLATALVIVGRAAEQRLPHAAAATTSTTLPAVPAPGADHPAPSSAVVDRLPLALRIDGAPEGMAVAAGSVWVIWDDSLLQVDPADDQVVSRTVLGHLPGGFSGLAVAGGSVWAQNQLTGTLYQIRLAGGSVRALRMSSDGPLAAGPGGALWLSACPGPGRAAGALLEVDPATRAVTRRVPIADCPAELQVGPTQLLALSASGRLWRIDPATGRVVGRFTLAGVGPVPGPLAGIPPQGGTLLETGGRLWATTTAGLLRIDPRTGRVLGLVRSDGIVVARAPDGLWTTYRGSVLRISPVDGAVEGVLPIDQQVPIAAAYAAGSVWVAASGPHRAVLLRVDPARVPVVQPSHAPWVAAGG